VPFVHGERHANGVVSMRGLEVISTDFTSPPSKTEVSRSSVPTQCCVDVHKTELYIWII
jgi:hypothetical protein